MGTFDSWAASQDVGYISIIEYLNNLARDHNSSILATIRYLLDNQLLANADLYEHSGYALTKKEKFGMSRFETPKGVLMGLCEDLTAKQKYTSLDLKINVILTDTAEYKKYKAYFLARLDLPAIIQTSQATASEFKPIKFDRAEAEKFAPVPLVNNQQTGKASEAQPLELSDNQKILQLMEMYNVHELACFITDLNPMINDNLYYDDLDYDSYCAIIKKAIKAGKLVADGSGEIMKDEAKRWLRSIGIVYRGFNDQMKVKQCRRQRLVLITG